MSGKAGTVDPDSASEIRNTRLCFDWIWLYSVKIAQGGSRAIAWREFDEAAGI